MPIFEMKPSSAYYHSINGRLASKSILGYVPDVSSRVAFLIWANTKSAEVSTGTMAFSRPKFLAPLFPRSVCMKLRKEARVSRLLIIVLNLECAGWG